MTLFQNKYRIESARLKGWDYSSDGYYFITICAHNRDQLFGRVENGEMVLNQYGTIVNQCWFDLPYHYGNMWLDAFVIMPDHIHGIVVIDNNRTNGNVGTSVETGFKPVSTIPATTIIPADSTNPNCTLIIKHHGLFEFVRAFKTFSARRINEIRNSPGIPVWQPRFHDHIIRDEGEFYRIQQYIIDNPKHWE